MIVVLQIIFWCSLMAVLYTYLGYPLLIRLLSRIRAHPVRKGPEDGKCSVVISAYNEARTLPAKVRSLLDSPNADCIDEIWIGSDGSDDDTVRAVEALGDPRIHVLAFEQRRGKPSVLNDLVPRCRSPFMVFTDARQELDGRAISRLLENFADERVGVVSGELVFRRPANASSTASGMDTYWRYEKFIRRSEAAFRSVPGATGALYAIRRELFTPIHPDILLDDVAIPLLIVLQGRRCVFEDDAVVYDVPSESGKAEEIRKRRTIAGNIQLVSHYPALLAPWRNPIWFEFVSHKMLRLFSPFLLLALLASNAVWLASCGGAKSAVFRIPCSVEDVSILLSVFLALQLFFYVLAGVGLRAGRHTPWTAGPAMFVRLNVTTVQAWGDALRGRYRVDWTRAYATMDP